MPEQSGERTQAPTPRRRQQAREKGQVAFSQDLGSATLLLVGVLALMLLGGEVVEFFGALLQQQLGTTPPLAVEHGYAVKAFDRVTGGLAKSLLPILGVLLERHQILHPKQLKMSRDCRCRNAEVVR